MKVDRITDSEDHVSVIGAESGTRLVPAGTILIVVRGMILAREFPVAITMREVAFNQDLKAVICSNVVSAQFVYYWLKANTHEILGTADEAAHGTKRIQTDRLVGLSITYPPLPTQRRIASILSAYDDLIENNTKRIKILEQQIALAFAHSESSSAGRIHSRKLGELADSAGGTIRTGPFGSALHESDYTPEGTPVIMPKNIRDGRVDAEDIARVPENIVETLEQHKLNLGDIVYGRRGDIGRRAFIRRRQSGWLCGTGCLRISLPSGALSARYLHEYLGKSDVIATIAAQAVGATMPNLNTTILRNVIIKIPPIETQLRFTEFATPTDELIEVLLDKNTNLRRTRDLLLPRLISGEIDVSKLELPA